MYKSSYTIFCCIIILFVFIGCGNSNKKKHLKEFHVEITGLDGNGKSEEQIKQTLYSIDGVKNIQFNYLEDEVIVNYDSLKTNNFIIMDKIKTIDNGKFKILDTYDKNPEPQKNERIKKPEQEEIGDDIDYNDNI